jgi:hypothetical protein
MILRLSVQQTQVVLLGAVRTLLLLKKISVVEANVVSYYLDECLAKIKGTIKLDDSTKVLVRDGRTHSWKFRIITQGKNCIPTPPTPSISGDELPKVVQIIKILSLSLWSC